PRTCPRCNSYRGAGMEGREIVEPLRTKGSQSFSLLVEDAFRLQSAIDRVFVNDGRKAITFSDSRQEAAILAGDLELDHRKDVFRQLIYRAVLSCEYCLGYGSTKALAAVTDPSTPTQSNACMLCDGTG